MKSIKLGVFSDTHGNLPALKAVLEAFDKVGVEKIYHCGDAICMGAEPRECVELLANTDNLIWVRGNHDNDFVIDRRIQMPDSHVSFEHKNFTFDSMSLFHKVYISNLPFEVCEEIFGLKVTFIHYARKDGKFYSIEHNPTAEKLDLLFDNIDSDIIFFGHRHSPTDLIGDKVYINIGSVGCHRESTANGIIFEVFEDGTYLLTRIAVPYNRQKAINELIVRNVAGRKEIIDNYFDYKPRE